MTPSFPGYQRRRTLARQIDLSEAERRELEDLDRQLAVFRQEHPDWSADKEPMRVSLFEAARRSRR